MSFKGIPFLMYHRIRSGRCPVPGRDLEETRYSVDLDVFREQIKWLADQGHRACDVASVVAAMDEGNEGETQVGVTFDDGNLSDYEHALPILAGYGFSATFFVGGDRVDAEGGLTSSMLRDMCDAGMEIGSHGMTHRFLPSLSREEQRSECETSRAMLSDITGRPLSYFSAPGGRYNATTIAILKETHYSGACMSGFGYNRLATNRFEMKRLPVMQSTGTEDYRGMVEGRTGVVLPRYVRASALQFARRVFGDGGYTKVRSLFVKE